MREQFSKELQSLKDMFTQMGQKTRDVIELAIISLKEHDLGKANKAIRLDDEVDELEREIENKCMSLIALQQPIAKDLRRIGTILKIITDIERIGDYGVNIAKITLSIGNEAHVKPLIDIPKMADLVKDMLKLTIESFEQENINMAKAVIQMDEQVDLLYSKINQDLQEIMANNPAASKQVTSLLLIGRYFERMADHTTNICERIIFMVTGDRIDIC
ncbi:phosphate uptake regulator, PhoU [Geosporobacter subterraneus DSM 17957]|uniref:Phosphate-specific transport system accessory protein PhoU n=1 Tax=Geosporobacter subterraneus DSM 17957 TaxID=1121919 RepID=A0A1M6GFN7_9FIRM|nr:phosphate signaling complex protein PhoU [Geosporobacter subterraneus]SHJ08774.1 phosphate uptake regulator, PhoU [Geosporobacter subterraneus DSM 17957]